MKVTGVQTCALPISRPRAAGHRDGSGVAARGRRQRADRAGGEGSRRLSAPDGGRQTGRGGTEARGAESDARSTRETETVKEPPMHRFAIASMLAAAAAYAQTTGGPIQSSKPAVQAHLDAAKAAAGSDFAGVYSRICREAVPPDPTPAPAQRGAAGGGGRRTGPPARDTWHAEPVKVFDNLYFLGQTEYSVWAIKTSDGLILIDAIFDYSVDDEVAGGLKKLGLDPQTIKYVVISHGHGDHSGGAKYLQDKFNARIVLTAADWDLLDRSNGTKPRRDVIAKDGDAITLGDTSVLLYNTAGHTLGTLSAIFPVTDHGEKHVVTTWGGTAFNSMARAGAYT